MYFFDLFSDIGQCCSPEEATDQCNRYCSAHIGKIPSLSLSVLLLLVF